MQRSLVGIARSGALFFSSQNKVPSIKFTESALEKFRSAKKMDHSIFVSLDTGGCAGVKLKVDHVKTPSESDVDLSQGYVDIFMDKESEKLLKTAVIDFEDTLMKTGFTIEHPAIVNSCGCNASYQLDFDYYSKKSP